MLSINIVENSVKIIEVERPEIHLSHEAIVMVTTTTISERDRFFQNNPNSISFIPGSEFAGYIVETGSDVNKFDINDLVINNSKSEEKKDLFFGSEKLPGGHAEYVKVPYADQNLAKITPAIEERAVLLGGDYLGGFYSLENFKKKFPKINSFIVYGFYNSTIAAIHSLNMQPHRKIFAVEKNSMKKNLFNNLVNKVFDSKIPTCEVLIVGLIEDQTDLFELIKSNNFKKIIFLEKQSASLFLINFDLAKNKIFIIEWPSTKHIEILIKKLLTKTIELSALISHVIPIQDSINAYELYRKKNTTSVLLKP
ncbi:MAG: alcohol dehydrogenase catalytic domain-containing protein [Dehalococcoidia bacterium]